MAAAKTFAMADPHIDHAAILTLSKRPFDNVQDMNKAIVDATNAVCTAKDTLVILGDVVWHKDVLGYAATLREFLKQLACKNVLIIPGNHDRVRGLKAVAEIGGNFHCIRYGGDLWTFSHYAMAVWPESRYGSYHGYGHMHGDCEHAFDLAMPGRRSMDFGVDNLVKFTGRYGPISLDEAKARLKDRTGWRLDHPRADAKTNTTAQGNDDVHEA